MQILCKKCAKLCQIVQKYDIKRKVFAIGLNHPKTKIPRVSAGFLGGDTGTRTLDPMIKSHLLYQLSYVPKTEPENRTKWFFFLGPGAILTYKKQKIKKNHK